MESAFCSGPLESVGGLELAGREQTPTHHRAVWFRSLQECLCSRSCWPWSQWRGGGEEGESEKNTVVLGPFLGDIFPLSFLQLQGFGTGARLTGGQINLILRCSIHSPSWRGRDLRSHWHLNATRWLPWLPLLLPCCSLVLQRLWSVKMWKFCCVVTAGVEVWFLSRHGFWFGSCHSNCSLSEYCRYRNWGTETLSNLPKATGNLWEIWNRPQMSWVFCLNHKTILPVSLVVPSASGIPFTNSRNNLLHDPVIYLH